MIKGQVHVFTYKDKNIVLDVNSNSLFTVDELAKEIIHLYPSFTLAEIIGKLNGKYDENKITEAYQEIQQLHQEGIIYSEGVLPEEEHDPEEFEIKSMCLHVSHDCNLRCKYCFAGTGPYGQKRSLMTFEQGKKAIDFLVSQAKNTSHFEIDFFGGEPLLNFSVVKQIVAYAREKEKETGKKFDFSLTTNGVYINEEVEEFIANENINLILSIDGRPEVNDKMRPMDDGSGSYQTIVKNYQRINSERSGNADNRYGRGIYTYYRGTFTSENLDFANDVLHLSDLGFKRISVEPVVLPENRKYAIKKDHLPELFEQYDVLTESYLERKGTDKEFHFHHFEVDMEEGPCFSKRITGCGAGYQYMAITPEGDIYPCHQFVGKKEMIIGNLKEGFTNKKLMNKFRNTNIYTKPACKECWARHLCGGGCHVNAYGFNDDLNKPYEVGCELTKKRFENALYLKVLELEQE
ncbi:thioether cross-link-forming SCIFF peptide maturase [Vulcanibacillus modesticaldus]|uniref:Thioether cross-link-forming SCIFF peptide maturase n=1 Tax=Vulcanibacillus modesticaldus TaxID=337097 RepID=A0A1D2YVN6_9BACI|nr:thioether cross-link-forming SCIFF peptide maturase [Vulcanibacillus modesticaldus]OEF99731.1 thioether cross-link-forming SCIFF peptide maturase [Vulcanibacillus modesticaldus]